MPELNDLKNRLNGFIAEYEAASATFRKELGQRFDAVQTGLTGISSNLSDIREQIFRQDVLTLESLGKIVGAVGEVAEEQADLKTRVEALEDWRKAQAS